MPPLNKNYVIIYMFKTCIGLFLLENTNKDNMRNVLFILCPYMRFNRANVWFIKISSFQEFSSHDFIKYYVMVLRTTPTSWNHNICNLHSGLDVLLKRWLDKLVVLFNDTRDVTPAHCNVPFQSPDQPDVRVCVHKNLHV